MEFYEQICLERYRVQHRQGYQSKKQLYYQLVARKNELLGLLKVEQQIVTCIDLG